jgi:hypothetical protein
MRQTNKHRGRSCIAFARDCRLNRDFLGPLKKEQAFETPSDFHYDAIQPLQRFQSDLLFGWPLGELLE